MVRTPSLLPAVTERAAAARGSNYPASNRRRRPLEPTPGCAAARGGAGHRALAVFRSAPSARLVRIERGYETRMTDRPAEKPTEQWVTGDEPMTGPQASYLETLAREAGEEPAQDLTKAQASDEIERLQAATGRSAPGEEST